MGVYSKKSLEILREKIDLVEVVSSYVQLKTMGSAYKGLCPFHDEKSPSFVIQKGESHYHCFGCGAHGDAIAFLMNYMKMSFVEAIESLAEKFQVSLEKVGWEKDHRGPGKKELRTTLQLAADFYHYYLLHTDEGHEVLDYLYGRGIDLDFIRLFKVGYAPKKGAYFGYVMKKAKVTAEALEQTGLVKLLTNGKRKIFFSGRIMFPIQDALGYIVGFSGRKVSEEEFGPKYVNTPETALFKKSRTLYGLHFSRHRIVKEKKAILVEGQIDALRLIQEGFDLTIAAQGTAFGEEHIKVLSELGVSHVYLALDGDEAGRIAASKIGHLFQKEGIEVSLAQLPPNSDPDTLLKEGGPPAFKSLLINSRDYLSFLLEHLAQGIDTESPSQKNRLVKTIVERIRSWDHPLMVHESLRKLAKLTRLPEKLIGVGADVAQHDIFVKRQGSITDVSVDPDRVLETDLLRWLFLLNESNKKLIGIIKVNVLPKHFQIPLCRRLFSIYLVNLEKNQKTDLIQLANNLNSVEEQLLFSEIVQKKVNKEKAEEGVVETVTKLLHRHWISEREKIRIQIQSGRCSEEEVLELARQFDLIKSNTPKIPVDLS